MLFPNFYVSSLWLNIVNFLNVPHEFNASGQVKTDFLAISSCVSSGAPTD
jgi:hypothetical protein